jgi:hypothetical protein
MTAPWARLSCFSGGFPHLHEQGQSSLKEEEIYELEFSPQAVLINEQTLVWAKKKVSDNFSLSRLFLLYCR